MMLSFNFNLILGFMGHLDMSMQNVINKKITNYKNSKNIVCLFAGSPSIGTVAKGYR